MAEARQVVQMYGQNAAGTLYPIITMTGGTLIAQLYGQNSTGTQYPVLTDDTGQLKVDTELNFSSGTIVGNVYTFKDAAGDAQYALVDASNRIILSPSGTVTVSSTGTVVVGNTAGNAGTLSVSLYGSASTVNSLMTNTLATGGTVISAVFANNAANGDGVNNTLFRFADAGSNVIYNIDQITGFNGTTWDRLRTISAVSGGTIGVTGLLASGIVGYDGSQWRNIAVDSSGNVNTKLNAGTVTVGNSSSNAGTLSVSIYGTSSTVNALLRNTAANAGTLSVSLYGSASTVIVGNSTSNSGTISASLYGTSSTVNTLMRNSGSNSGTVASLLYAGASPEALITNSNNSSKTNGVLNTGLMAADNTFGSYSALQAQSDSDGNSIGWTSALSTSAFNTCFNGTSWDRVRSTGVLSGGTMPSTGLIAAGLMRLEATGGNWQPAFQSKGTTTTGTLVQFTTAASTLIAANTTRSYAILRNLSSSTLFLGFNRAPSTVNADLYLNQYDTYELNSTGLFTGNLQGIGTGSGSVTLLEW